MALTPTPVCVQTPKMGVTTPFASTYTPSTLQALYTAGSNGSKVVSAWGLSTDTVARVAQLWLTRSAANYLLASFSIPAASGTDGATATANLFSLFAGMPRDNDGQVYIFLQPSDVLNVSLTAAPASGKTVWIQSQGADF